MSTTLIICVTIIVVIGMLVLAGVSIFTSKLKFKREGVNEYRRWSQALLNQLYTYVDKWIDKMCE